MAKIFKQGTLQESVPHSCQGVLLDTFFTIVQCFNNRDAYREGCDRETSIR